MNNTSKRPSLLGFALIAAGLVAAYLFGYQYLSEILYPHKSPDFQLQQLVSDADLQPINLGPTQDPNKVELGRMLFFDKELSGNRDISCATCHHPQLASGDGRILPAGTGASGLGLERQLGENRTHVPRNAPEIFNRGAPEWETMFWDGRISWDENGRLINPGSTALPVGLDGVLAVQAMFPVTSQDEMRGEDKDITADGYANEIGAIHHADSAAQLQQIWSALMERILAFPEYQALFAAAYPEVPTDQLSFMHAANAIAAFEIAAFSFDDSPWDQYLAGTADTLSEEAKRGALLFYGQASCATCHSGSLFTDQAFHNIGVPQFGPGKTDTGFDPGRFQLSGDTADMCAFRTPPLRNVELTAPYMHNGAYLTLEETIRHHIEPVAMLYAYDPALLPTNLQDSYLGSDDMLATISQNISPLLPVDADLDDQDITDLVAFLHSLTSPSVLSSLEQIPKEVPSGLPVND